ncbi:MAG: CPBP family intramembrane metalloprotease [Candidatus Riflebacteria bacterium]|nr:CPBP family intramembrane metalloprotease [Candidatus Riflebacteria bacterium]
MIKSSREETIEACVIFLMLLPFYLLMLPAPGSLKIFGFFYLAGIVGYMLFLTPHRLNTKVARKSLLEVFIVLIWTLVTIWGILPTGKTAGVLGDVLLGFSIFYILFLSGPLNKDTHQDWGIGSPSAFLEYLKKGEHRNLARMGFLLVNLFVIAGCFFFPEGCNEILTGLLRRSIGIKLQTMIPQYLIILGFLTMANLFLICVVRYDNLVQVAKFIAIYFLVGSFLVFITGYVYIYLLNNGYVELIPQRGIIRIGTYIFWGTLQELLFLSYFNTRIRKGISSPLLSSLLTAVIFSIYHLTAYTLMFICFLVGILWALIFQTAPNLFALGVCHGISGGFGSFFQVHGMTIFKIKGSVGPFNM